jgi:hypothetical protein
MEIINKHLDLLGSRVKDRVTGFSGVVTTVGFDLYGCIQGVVNPGVDKDGKPQDSQWFDVNRLIVLEDKKAMDPPRYDWSPAAVSAGGKGCAEKPAMVKP